MIQEPLKELKKGEKILFNSRKIPLTVKEIKEDKVIVEGPNGGKYQIYIENNSLLVSKSDSRKYSSYCQELRKVGRWKQKEDNHYVHSKSGAENKLEQSETGYWHIKTSLDISSYDIPKYGFNDKEVAEKQLNKIKRDHPEG